MCVGTAGTGCLAAATLAAAVNVGQTAQNGGGIADVAISAFKSYAVVVPGVAEFAAEATEVEALAMMARYGISTEGWAAPAALTYGSRLFYQGAVAVPDVMELYRSQSGNC